MILTNKTFQDRRLKLIVTGLEIDFDTCIFQFMEYEDATKLRFWAYLWKCCNAKIGFNFGFQERPRLYLIATLNSYELKYTLHVATKS